MELEGNKHIKYAYVKFDSEKSGTFHSIPIDYIKDSVGRPIDPQHETDFDKKRKYKIKRLCRKGCSRKHAHNPYEKAYVFFLGYSLDDLQKQVHSHGRISIPKTLSSSESEIPSNYLQNLKSKKRVNVKFLKTVKKENGQRLLRDFVNSKPDLSILSPLQSEPSHDADLDKLASNIEDIRASDEDSQSEDIKINRSKKRKIISSESDSHDEQEVTDMKTVAYIYKPMLESFKQGADQSTSSVNPDDIIEKADKRDHVNNVDIVIKSHPFSRRRKLHQPRKFIQSETYLREFQSGPISEFQSQSFSQIPVNEDHQSESEIINMSSVHNLVHEPTQCTDCQWTGQDDLIDDLEDNFEDDPDVYSNESDSFQSINGNFKADGTGQGNNVCSTNGQHNPYTNESNSVGSKNGNVVADFTGQGSKFGGKNNQNDPIDYANESSSVDGKNGNVVADGTGQDNNFGGTNNPNVVIDYTNGLNPVDGINRNIEADNTGQGSNFGDSNDSDDHGQINSSNNSSRNNLNEQQKLATVYRLRDIPLPDEEEDVFNYRMENGLRHVDPDNPVAESEEIYLGEGLMINRSFWNFIKSRGSCFIFLREILVIIWGLKALANRCIRPQRTTVVLENRSLRKKMTPTKYKLAKKLFHDHLKEA